MGTTPRMKVLVTLLFLLLPFLCHSAPPNCAGMEDLLGFPLSFSSRLNACDQAGSKRNVLGMGSHPYWWKHLDQESNKREAESAHVRTIKKSRDWVWWPLPLRTRMQHIRVTQK